MAKKKAKHEVVQSLDEASSLFQERNEEYGDGYKRIGKIVKEFFPEGVDLLEPEDYLRFQTFTNCVTKLNRYAQNFESGGHKDSSFDLINYAAILDSITEG